MSLCVRLVDPPLENSYSYGISIVPVFFGLILEGRQSASPITTTLPTLEVFTLYHVPPPVQIALICDG